MSGFRNSSSYQEFDTEANEVGRKRSLIRPERQRMDSSHPRFHYTQVASQQASHLRILPSDTGLDPVHNTEAAPYHLVPEESEEGIPLMAIGEETQQQGREQFGLNDEGDQRRYLYKRASKNGNALYEKEEQNKIYFWKVYCYIITFWAPSPLLRLFGMKTKSRQFAWREKIGLISCILYIGAFVAYITFGFTRTVCSAPRTKVKNGAVSTSNLIINGRIYDMSLSQHPGAAGVPAGSNVLYPPVNAGGQDASFLFQNVNGHCRDIIMPRDNCSIPHDDQNLAWYMPCRVFSQYGADSLNTTEEFYQGWACHTSSAARDAYYSLQVSGDVYFTWDEIRNSSRNLVVYSGTVLDLDLLNWIQTDDLTYPTLFDELRDQSFRGHDISLILSASSDRRAAQCLTEIIRVGVIDSETIGCIASQVVLIISLVFILSVVVVKFVFACYYKWVVSRKQGADIVDNRTMGERDREIEQWSEDPTAVVSEKARHATASPQVGSDFKRVKTNRQSVFFQSNQSAQDLMDLAIAKPETPPLFKYTTMGTQAAERAARDTQMTDRQKRAMKTRSVFAHSRHSSMDLLARNSFGPFENMPEPISTLGHDICHPDVEPQKPHTFEPYGYPLVHTICMITAYSEDEEALRTTMDSVANTDYPNSNKLLVVICDGLIKGSGNDRSTPEIALDLMTDFCVPKEEVKAHSYVAVALGSKRHNMAKVYAGFYKCTPSEDSNKPPQRVPVILIVKCGTPEEAGGPKPGNRGKRDSQIILMSFLQKVTFDERMTALEFVILESIWRVTGIMAEFYEIVLMVDADTKVYPDCLTHMCAEMVKDPLIMGLCGETKIANKNQSWVTAIQVFEYYISHHQAKAFESVFGGVTCLPGCFCMYRIKAPKGNDGYWVPILANPDIVERYSDNEVDTLHKKNLLLLGEDRYLTSLMLKTFPKRKQVFVSKAACKTVVPDKFSVLLSQRRRWINSTVHNLMELVLVKDLCGTFCFSMQFVIFIELIGTLCLPAAISFTVYVIIVAIISHPTPIMSLVLLGIIFGLPGCLIVVTVSSLKYVIYFFIYLIALPIWNFVLPTYAFWKFDDFSWGETRTVIGESKGDHGNADGAFDSSKIMMKKWREWEQERVSDQSASIAAPGPVWHPTNVENDTYYSEESTLSP
ncbi:hypothetical protein PUMCH_005134 [Australozyma saopauloensis]|uniref:chitin synthase n=1 Tax=Australozyma saopauloensis TaxID=291208 RepID=A0AAX4HH27_9ASCO|nr:hypothetical protein PUMCH_005134 [[Candida] saopauloensis]